MPRVGGEANKAFLSLVSGTKHFTTLTAAVRSQLPPVPALIAAIAARGWCAHPNPCAPQRGGMRGSEPPGTPPAPGAGTEHSDPTAPWGAAGGEKRPGEDGVKAVNNAK